MQPHTNPGIQRRFILSIALTLTILAAEVIGGLWTGSLALLSDAAHVFTDIFALALSFLALRLSALPADDRHSFGYHRLEVFAALINGVSLILIAFGIGWEAVERWQSPQPVRSAEMFIIAVVGMVVNIMVAFILNGHDHAGTSEHANTQDLNIRSAFLHVIGDAISSLGVIVAAILISVTGLQWIDPLASLLIGALILFSAFRVTRSALHILIEGVPEGLSIQKIAHTIFQTAGVADVHDLHVWNICSGHVALSAHVTLAPGQSVDHPALLDEIRGNLLQKFGIQHTTLQLENTRCSQVTGGCGNTLLPLHLTLEK